MVAFICHTRLKSSKVLHHPEVLVLRGFPGGFLLSTEPVALKCSNQSSIDFVSGTESFRCNVKIGRKLSVLQLRIKTISLANALYAPV